MAVGATKDDRDELRRRALLGVLGKTNRILTGDKKLVVEQMPDLGGMPAASAYPFVWIGANAFEQLDKRAVMNVLGLNYHELSHIMFTPRKFKADRVVDDLMLAWMILEDQRIESLFAATYQPAGKYFTQTIIKHFVNKRHVWRSAFAYTYGRSYLPLEIRQEFESRFRSPDLVDEFKDCIDEFKSFRTMHFERRAPTVMRCLTRFSKLLLASGISQSQAPPDCTGTDQGDGQVDEKKEKEAIEKDQEKREEEEETGEDQSGFWEEDDDEDSDEAPGDAESASEEDDDEPDGGDDDGGGAEDESDSDSSPDDADGGDGSDEGDDEGASDSDAPDSGDVGDDATEDDDSSGGSEADGEDSDSDESEESDDDADDERPGGPGSLGEGEVEEGDEPLFEDDEDLREYLGDILDRIESDEAVTTEVGRVMEAVQSPGLEFLPFDVNKGQPLKVPVGVAKEVALIQQEYRRLWADVEPGWKYGSDVGKLNVGRAMQDPENYEEMFDEWDEGREQDTGLEVVIINDLSSSMKGPPIVESAKVVWALKRSLDEIDAKVSVLNFSYTVRGWYSRDDRVEPGIFHVPSPFGGTNPSDALELARKILSASEMPNKILVVITDGAWNRAMTSVMGQKPYTEAIDEIPGIKIYFGISNPGSGGGDVMNGPISKRFHVSQKVTQISSITNAVSRAVSQILSSRR